jgi:protein gp37
MVTHIQWTKITFNVMTGCTKYSQGCANCYAKRQAEKLQGDANPRTAMKYANGFKFTVHPRALDDLEQQLHGWRKPHKVFINSMSDTFHEEAPEDFILRLFEIMEKYPRHIFQVLTKRAHRMAALARRLPWPRNVWAGVTVESDQYVER